MAGLGNWLSKTFGPAARQDRQHAIDILAPQIQKACVARDYIAYRDMGVARNSASDLIDYIAKQRAEASCSSVMYSRVGVIAQILRDGGKTGYGQLLRDAEAKDDQGLEMSAKSPNPGF